MRKPVDAGTTSRGELCPRTQPDRPGRGSASALANLLAWSDVDRCRLLILVTLPYFVGYALRASHLAGHPGVEPYYDPQALLRLRDGMAIVALLWTAFLAWGQWERRRPAPHGGYLWVGGLSWWIGISGVAYALGPVTSPAWIALVIGGVAQLLLLPRRMALAGLAVGLTLTVAGIGAAAAGWIPYAPALAGSPVLGSHLSLPYAFGNTLASVLATLLVVAIVGYLVSQWRDLVAALRAANRSLEETVADRTRELERRRRAEAALRASEERYRLIAENAGDLVAELDARGRYAYVSPNYEAILGHPPAELLESNPFRWVHPDHRSQITAALERIERTGRAETQRYRFRHRDGRWRWLESHARSFRTSRGEIHTVIVCQDVTERLREEERRARLEARVQQTQKLETLGVLAGGVAHDFNNLLLPILGNTRLAKIELESEAAAHRYLDRAETAAVRAAELTDTLLAYAGKGHVSSQSLQVGPILEEMVGLLHAAIPAGVELRLEVPRSLPPIRGNPAQLRQVVMNLVTNAFEAIGEKPGLVTVSAGTVEVTEGDLSPSDLGAELRPGPYVFLEVRDTGCGMDPETRERIFDPFFTTKSTGRGLGLAALSGIVRTNQGAIRVESEPGRGTRFRLLFPALAESAPRAAREESHRAAWRASGLVLLVDDEEAVLELLEEVIPRTGLSVISARDGREAIERFREYAPKIVAVVLDLTMPEMGGLAALREIRRIRPNARVILSSGYRDAELAERLEYQPVDAFLQKPYPPEELVSTLRAVLEA